MSNHTFITWTKHFDNVIIYNKGKDDIDEYNPIKLNNVGREGHTYYKYIYDNYDNLADYTIFLQGCPFGHCYTIIEDIKEVINNPNYNKQFQYFSHLILKINLKNDYNIPIEKNKENTSPTFTQLIDNLDSYPSSLTHWFGDNIQNKEIAFSYEKYINLTINRCLLASQEI